MRDSKNFEDARRAHAAANAHGHADTLGTTALALNQGVAGQALTADAIRVTHSDCASVDIEQLRWNMSERQ